MSPRRYGRWKIEKSIDEGGQAHVFLVTDLQKEKLGNFALKRLKDRSRADLFYREMEAIRRLQHPNVIQIEDMGTIGDKPYYVMEYCKAGSLERVGGSAF